MSRGAQRERAVRDSLQEQDWVVIHTRPGTNFCDIVALKPHRALFVEVKSTAGGPYERFTPDKRADLLAVAERAGAEAWLAWWPAYGKLTWLPSNAWPDKLRAA